MNWKGKKKVLYMLIITMFVIPSSAAHFTIIKNEISIIKDSTNIANSYLNNGWLEERKGVKIIHLNGSYYEMGYQHGFLLSNEIREVMRAQLVFFEESGYTYERLLDIWNVMGYYLPNEYMDEMQGMADGAGLSFENIAVLNTMSAVFNLVSIASCCEISLWGDATLDGKLIHVRSWDWDLQILDPETGNPLQKNIVMIIRNPQFGYASITPDFAGSISVWHGINEKGIVVGENSCYSWDTTFHGINQCFRMRMVLDQCDTGEKAITILTSNRTCGTNFILSDANVPIGYALDQTANFSYVGTWNDPVEDTYPFWQIKDVVRRSIFYIDPECASVEFERFQYNPSGLKSFIYACFGRSGIWFRWIHFRELSEQIERYYGTFDVNSTMKALREEYTGKSSFLMYFNTRILGIWQCLYQWVVCPETGEMVISFASSDTRACYEPIYYFNIFNLIEAEKK